MATPDNSQLMHLGTKGGIQHWLDLETGRQFPYPELPAPFQLGPAMEALADRGFKFRRAAEDRLEAFFVDAAGGRLRLAICCDGPADNLFLLLRAPCWVPRRRRAEAAEYLTRANWGMSLGSFDMDWSDGEVVYRVSTYAPGTTLTAEVVVRMVDAALWAVRTYADGLERTIVGEAPASVIAEVESQD